MPRSLITTKQLDYSDLIELWTLATTPTANSIETLSSTVSLLFESPSTRTKFGFELAAQGLGAQTISLGSAASRLASGESLEDTLHTLTQMSDQIVVVRTHTSLSQLQLKDSRVVNAGDSEEHPTQALVDLFTIASLMDRPLQELADFTIYCCAGSGAPLRPIVSLCWLLQTLRKGEVVLISETPLPHLELPRLQIVESWSPPSADKTAFGYVLESFSEQGNIQPSSWVEKRLLEMAVLPNLHPLPRLQARDVVIKDTTFSSNPLFQTPTRPPLWSAAKTRSAYPANSG